MVNYITQPSITHIFILGRLVLTFRSAETDLQRLTLLSTVNDIDSYPSSLLMQGAILPDSTKNWTGE